MKRTDDIPEEEFEQIGQFVTGRLLPEQMQELKDKMETDPRFKNRVQQVRLMILGIKESALGEKLASFHGEMETPVIKMKSAQTKRLRPFMMAASILIMCIAGALFFINNDAGKKLYSNFYQPDAGLITAMGEGGQYDFERAMVDYKTGKYNEAITAWQKLLEKDPQNDTLQYFIGSAYLAKGDPEPAVNFLKPLADRVGIFREEACWYLGLVYVKEGNKTEARKYLQQANRPEKEKLLKKLDN